MKKLGFAVLIVILAGLIGAGVAFADPGNGQEVCPHDGDWIKIDTTGDPMAISIAAPAGFLIDDVCTKRATIIDYRYDLMTTNFGINYGDHAISHYSYTLVEIDEHPPEYKTTTSNSCFGVFETNWKRLWNTRRERYGKWFPIGTTKIHEWTDLLTRETWGEITEPKRCQWLKLNNDCEGFELYLHFLGKKVVLFEGEWLIKEELEVATFEDKILGTIDIFEPEECYECIAETVFYWTDGYCEIRQRGGPIGGQERPFIPMQDLYCGCGYGHDEGWEGLYANSCTGPEEYKFWNELPKFCGATPCE